MLVLQSCFVRFSNKKTNTKQQCFFCNHYTVNFNLCLKLEQRRQRYLLLMLSFVFFPPPAPPKTAPYSHHYHLGLHLPQGACKRVNRRKTPFYLLLPFLLMLLLIIITSLIIIIIIIMFKLNYEEKIVIIF